MAILIRSLICFAGCLVAILGLSKRDPVWIVGGAVVAVAAARATWKRINKQ